MIRERIKWFLFPGVNLHARLRGRALPAEFGSPSNGHARRVLDAGCGNGMLAYHSFRRGNSVVGISIKTGEIARNQVMFHEFLGLPRERLSFRVHNIYDVEQLGMQFDENICTEVLEHIANDRQVCASFFRMLKPGGVLHLCCPNAAHPDHQAMHLDEDESGGHVRNGYTLDTYRALLEPIGFKIEKSIGLGGPLRQWCNKWILRTEKRLGRVAGLGLFMIFLPSHWLDTSRPRVPYSLYVRAEKPAASAAS
jgi:SAM-dependent methyltransferase